MPPAIADDPRAVVELEGDVAPGARDRDGLLRADLVVHPTPRDAADEEPELVGDPIDLPGECLSLTAAAGEAVGADVGLRDVVGVGDEGAARGGEEDGEETNRGTTHRR